ncbi:acyl-CoA dehydrogenase family protein [Amycolatopsis roodepoortensis]|uniref:acyl-CoA dehydrogenase family protein n=1 Tax=Amycolatopsis roodepoortensis TaxID=700274 RepID=UPI00214B1B23|nr:acyl-CoA dehydrogenase family protein [Amycolatopsis roodepoortensis]UUV33762.1 acyl-CoA dehydrogenase family protein [Amycolatopsis roodepoortensis]
MDFQFDETQTEVTALAARVLGKEREPADTWRALADAGLLALALPAELGGDGLGVAEVALVLTELGRVASPTPALASLAFGVLPVTALGGPDQRSALLPPVAAGEALLTAALHEPSAPFTTRPATVAESAGDWRLSGVKVGVPFAAEATRILTPASMPGGTGVFLVDPHADGVTLTPTRTSSGTPDYTMTLDSVTVTDADLLNGHGPGESIATLHRFALAGAVAFGDGLLAGALALTTKHVGEREQFGRPLAAFQAVAQQIADVYVASRTVQLAARSAVWRLAARLDAEAELDIAAYWLAEEAPAALAVCHHLHGGIGVDETYPLHRFSSAVKDLGRTLGGATHRLAGLGELVAG